MRRLMLLLIAAFLFSCLSGCINKPLLDIDIDGIPAYHPNHDKKSKDSKHKKHKDEKKHKDDDDEDDT